MKYINKYKQELKEEYGKYFSEELWKSAMKRSRGLFAFGENEYFRQISKRAKVLYIDQAKYKSKGILSRIEEGLLSRTSKDITIYDIYKSAKENIYSERTEEFRKIHGDFSFEYDFGDRKETITLNEIFNKLIIENYSDENRKLMNKIIKYFEDTNQNGYEVETYNNRNNASNQSVGTDNHSIPDK